MHSMWVKSYIGLYMVVISAQLGMNFSLTTATSRLNTSEHFSIIYMHVTSLVRRSQCPAGLLCAYSVSLSASLSVQ